MGVATGCGFKEIYRFPHTTYPYSSCICTFLQQHPYFFVHFLNVFRSCSSTFFKLHFKVTGYRRARIRVRVHSASPIKRNAIFKKRRL